MDFPRISLIAAALLAPCPAAADPIVGIPVRTDGDTLRLGTQRIRRYGIDAPERHQGCQHADGTAWTCGADATKALAGFIGGRSVSCDKRDVDPYQRIVAVCAVAGQDLGLWLVSNGWALAYRLAYRRYSSDYVVAEDQARKAKRGLWAGAFQPPWEYRRGQ